MPGANGGHSLDGARRIFKMRGDPCGICGGPIDYSLGYVVDSETGRKSRHPLSAVVDHKVPSILGGTDDLENLQSAHYRCNASKGARLVSSPGLDIADFADDRMRLETSVDW